jgi:hypothetical protein
MTGAQFFRGVTWTRGVKWLGGMEDASKEKKQVEEKGNEST